MQLNGVYYYIGNFIDQRVKDTRGFVHENAAASAKMLRLCKAIKRAGASAKIISLGRSRTRATWRYYPVDAAMVDGVEVRCAAYWDAPILNHVTTVVSLARLVATAKTRDRFIFYNNQIHGLLPLLIARIMGRRCTLDFEDGLRRDLPLGARFFEWLLLKAYELLINRGVLLASTALRQQTCLAPQYVCYGAAPEFAAEKEWETPRLNVFFGGSLLPEGGVYLLRDAIRSMRAKGLPALSRIRFVITGFGPLADEMRALAAELPDVVEFRGHVTASELHSVLREAHVGLCLRLPQTGIGSTTFPSKIIEIAASGLLLLSTRASDVTRVFSTETALLLDEPTPERLIAALESIVIDIPKARALARRGQAYVQSALSFEATGSALLGFFDRQERCAV